MSRKALPLGLLPFAVLILLPTILLWPAIIGNSVFLPADLLQDITPWKQPNGHLVPWNPLLWDSMAEFYPWRLFASETLRSGYIPLWNPHELCGTPFLANSQSAILYPLNIIFLLFPVAKAFGISVCVHLILTGIFAYLFLRSGAFNLSPAASLVGALTWQLSAWQVSWLALPTFLCVSCWLPLALLLVWQANKKNTVLSWCLVGLCLGVIVLAGHLQIALYCLGMVFIYTAFLFFSGKQFHSGIVLSIALMAALSAPQLLPSFELAHVSHRSGGVVNWHSYTQYTKLAFPLQNLITLWLPGIYGNPSLGNYWGIMTNGGPSAYMENACYIGLVSLTLVVLGTLATWKSQSETRFFSIIAIVALLMALGTPIDALPYFGLPGYSQSASPGRVLVIWTFCGAVLASIGTEFLIGHFKENKPIILRGLGIFAFGAIVVIGGTIGWIFYSGPHGVLQFNLPRIGSFWRVPAALLLALAVLLWLYERGTVSTQAFGYLLSALVALDLLSAGFGYNHFTNSNEVYPATPAIRSLQQIAGNDRVLILNHNWSLQANRPPTSAIMPPNAATVYGLDEVGGYDSLLTLRSLQFVGMIDGADPAPPENGNMVFTSNYLSSLANDADARYIVSQAPLTDPKLKLISQDKQMCVYSNPSSSGRATFSGQALSLVYDPISPTRTTVRLNALSPGALTIANQWYPGWQAKVNGQPVPIALVNNLFQQIEIARAGEEYITIDYRPMSFQFGLYCLLSALLVTTGVAVSSLYSRRSCG